MCDYLKNLVINSNVDVEKAKELIPEGCEDRCDENEYFDFSESLVQPTCANPKASAAQSGYSAKHYRFICVCKSGFVRSSTKCVPPSDCGCSDDEGKQREINEQWRSEDCKTLHTCVGEKKINTVEAPCGANTECKSTEHGFACVCQEGKHGNPSCPYGCVDGELSNDGSETCYNYVDCTGVNVTYCTCNDGYLSSCNGCEDQDECKDGNHECNLDIENCENYPGGYKCVCKDGYELVKQKCQDINECEKDRDICSAHRGCINIDVGYKCVCCAGYTENPNTNVCEPNLRTGMRGDNDRCCHNCPDRILCNEEKPYCYTDENNTRRDYPAFIVMFEELCLNGTTLQTDRYQQGTCESTKPPTTGTDGGTEQPKNCDDSKLCSAISPPSPAFANGPVCGPAGSPNAMSFPSFCDYVKSECKKANDLSSFLRIASVPPTLLGECSKNQQRTPAEPIFSPWGPYSSCKFDNGTCGLGEQISTRDVVPREDDRPIRQVKPEELVKSTTCFKPCQPDGTNTTPDCIDPDIYCVDVDPVCGIIGVGAAQTYDSECALAAAACEKGIEPKVLYRGPCDDKDDGSGGRLCSKGPVYILQKYDLEDASTHCVGPVVTIGSCAKLLCDGKYSEECCRVTKYEQIGVDLRCTTNDERKEILADRKHVHLSAVECECQDQDPSQSLER